MTMLTNMQISVTRPFVLRAAVRLGHFRRFINRLVVAMLARHERNAVRAALYRLGDRELEDIGIYRTQIESSLEDVAQTRARMQQPGWH